MNIVIGTKTIIIPDNQLNKLYKELYDWLIEHKIQFKIEENDKEKKTN